MIPLFKAKPVKDLSLLEEVLSSGMTGEGPKVSNLCTVVQGKLQQDKVVLTNSCTSALVMALRLSGVGVGTEVLTSPFTMIATNTAIKQAGGDVVFYDISPDTLSVNIDWFFKHLHTLINTRTRAVVVTLVGGIVPDGIELLYESLPSNCKLILDCAHAYGTMYKKKPLTDIADFYCYSFQSIKHLNCGDGGALVCADSADYLKAKDLKWFGMSREVPSGKTRLEHQMSADVFDWGYKFHMNDVAAAIGLTNVEAANESIISSHSNASYYQERFKDTRIGTLEPKNQDPSWWMYGVHVQDREDVINKLAVEGIVASPMWRMNNNYTCFRYCKHPVPEEYNGVRFVERHTMFIPNGWWVTRDDRRFIADSLINIVEGEQDED